MSTPVTLTHHDLATELVRWFIQLRWVAVFGQLTTVLVVWFVLHIDVMLIPLLMIIAATCLSQVALQIVFWQLRARAKRTGFDVSPTSMPPRPEEQGILAQSIIGIVMAADLVVLTSLLYFSGGAANPFVVFYIVNLCLAATMLSATWSWILTALSLYGFVFLLMYSKPLSIREGQAEIRELLRGSQVGIEQVGLFVAVTTCIVVIVYFTTMLNSQLRKRELELREAERLQAKTDKLQALGTLAAGAAHELATPLSTIAVTSTELHRELQRLEASPEVREDVKLIRSEVDRCRKILDRMSIEAGQMTWEQIETITIEELFDEINEDLKHRDRVQFQLDESLKEEELTIPLGLLAQALRGIVKNAIEATPPPKRISCKADLIELPTKGNASPKRVARLLVIDQGQGITPDDLVKIGDPFFTTKPTGQGMGLGLFLARSVIERLKGSMTINSLAGQGTTVTITLPLNGSVKA